MDNVQGTSSKKERNFPILDLKDLSTLNAVPQPVLVVQSPKTPTLSKKLKAVSLDSDPPTQSSTLDVSRDVFSMPNTPKRQIKKLSCDFDDGPQKCTLAPSFSSNLKKFASNNSISGSQTLKTLPEIMTLHDFSSDSPPEPIKIRTKGLLERRGSNASLTIDLGSNSNIAEARTTPLTRLNSAKSVSNLNLSTFGSVDRACSCYKKCEALNKSVERRKSQETCGNCIIYESVPSKINNCKIKCQNSKNRCSCCTKSRRKSLSNENLYVPPCGFCQTGAPKDCTGSSKHCKGYRKAFYPRQPDLESSQLLSEDFKLHLQNIQYLQTAGNVLTIDDLNKACEISRVPKLHQEFWEVPLNLQEKCYVSGSQTRNRYRGVLPNEHSRVYLSGSQSYIHANYIKGPDYTETAYIATQGPMAHTCQDFWEMVWNTHCKCIVMLTGLVEKGRNKCELYFPLGKKNESAEKSFFYVKTMKVRDKFTFDGKNNQQYEMETHEYEELNDVSFGNYNIKYIKEEDIDQCHIRQLELTRTDTNSEPRTVRHYWLSDWPDHKMACPEQVLKIALDVLNVMESNKKLDNNTNNISRSNEESHVKSTKPKPDLKPKVCHNKCRVDVSKHTFSKRESALALLKNSVPQERKKSTESIKLPVIVHCSAGIGRTGCFLAILNGIQQLKNNSNVDVLAILCSLRLNRGGMVQTAEQYELIHRVLSLYTKML